MKQKQFNKYKLSDYSAFAITFLCLHSVDAKVVYTDIEPDYILDSDLDHAVLDIDGDGTGDFWFWNVSYYTFSIFTTYIEKLWAGAIGDSRNEIAGVSTWPISLYYKPYALIGGSVIDNNLSFQNWAYQRMAWQVSFTIEMSSGSVFYLQDSGGYWFPEKTDHYLGIHFVDDDEKYHYGWIRCSVLDSGRILIIKDYAYERFVDSSIVAGDVVGVEPNVIFNSDVLQTDLANLEENITLVYFFNNVLYFNLPPSMINTRYAVYALDGRSTIRGELHDNHSEVTVNLPAGSYLIEIIADGKSIVKKVYIN